MANALIPELAVSDWNASKEFYMDILGFRLCYERPEEGFAFLALGKAELMIDQIGMGRTFDDGHLPDQKPFGRGLNVQIEVESLAPILERLGSHTIRLYLPVEEKWYRNPHGFSGHKQCVVADPDGYLLRLFEDLGLRKMAP